MVKFIHCLKPFDNKPLNTLKKSEHKVYRLEKIEFSLEKKVDKTLKVAKKNYDFGVVGQFFL